MLHDTVISSFVANAPTPSDEHALFVRMFVEVLPRTDDDANNEFERYVDWLDNNPAIINIANIERLLGEAYGYKQIRMISMLNNLIRKHKLPTTKEGIAQSAYFSQPIRNDREFVDLVCGTRSKYEGPQSVPELNVLFKKE